MAIQTFTAGQVLTAAQVNALQANDYNQTVSTKTGDYVLVAADKGTRVVMNSASAQTITVNTSLFSAGDTLFIQNIGAGVCTITAGTATVATAGSLALAQNAGGTLYFTSTGVSIFFPTVATCGATGLVFISKQTFTTSAAVNINNCFSSTYTNYKLLINATGSTAAANGNIRMRVGGVDNSALSYKRQFLRAISTTVSGSYDTLNETNVLDIGTGNSSVATVDIFSPNLAVNTRIQAHFNGCTATGNNYVGFFETDHNVATAYDGFSLIPSTGTTTGTIWIYGYEKG